MSTINPYFDPILGKLRNSDIALISLATLVVTDPLVVNNLVVNSNASINTINAVRINSSQATLGYTHISTIDWNLTSGASLPVEGQMNWDSVNGTVVVGMAGGNVDVALGMETLFPKRVKNSTATLMPKGSAVYINGVSGNDPTIAFAKATSDMTSAYTIGLTSEDIAAGQKGWITTFGEITGLNLSAFTGGDTLFLSAATAGLFTNQRQYAPNHYVRLGTVVKATPDGSLVVNVINGFETNELHDVSITSLASGQILQSGASSLWYNRSLASAVAEVVTIPTFPSLGSLAVLNSLSYYALDSRLSLGSLAVQNNLSYYSLDSKLSLGSLSVLNNLSYYSLDSKLSLGSLAIINNISYFSLDSRLSLGSLAVQNNLSYFSLDSKLSLGSLAVLNTLNGLLPSTASFNLILTNGVANYSTVSTYLLRANGITAATASVSAIRGNSVAVDGTIYAGDQIQAGGQIYGNSIDSATTISAVTDISAGGAILATGTISGSNLSGNNYGDQIMPVYGDGSDGSVYFNGTNSYNFATLNSSTYTLTRDVFATDFTVESGIVLITAGYRVFAQLYITVSGTIHNNGSDGSGTTGGTGGLGGFFKAGGAGAAGLGTGSAGANGTAQATPTANTLVGGIGGKGAMGRASTTTFTGGMITSANVTVPADADGGNKVQSNYINYLTRYIVGATNWQMTPSIGGGSGAKSATGTSATSGAGGGGGGIVFLASPIIDGQGTISANGGAGGSASGTGGNFGGGGGGGGGIVCYIAKSTAALLYTPTASGGAGGTSVIGTNGTLPVATANGTTTTATQTMTLTPTVPLTKGNLYMVTFHLQITGGISGSGINSMSGFGMTWVNLNTRVEFNSIASPTRVIETWYGYYEGTEPDLIDDGTITVNLSNLNTTARVIIDEIQNTDAAFGNNPVTANKATNRVDSATTLTVTLPNAPTTGNLVYSVFGRSAGTVPTAGAGNTIVNSQTTAPQLVSQVSSAQQANTQTHTTASAVAGISVEITKSTSGKNGSNGWNGKVVRIYG